MTKIKHEIRERFEVNPIGMHLKFSDGLELLVNQTIRNAKRQPQEVKLGSLNDPSIKLKIGGYKEGFRVLASLDHDKINLQGEYWDRLEYPSEPVLYNTFYNFVNGVREFRKKFGEDENEKT